MAAYLSLFVAVSGTAFAAVRIDSGDIVNKTIKNRDIAKETIKGNRVNESTLTGLLNNRPNTVGASHIQNPIRSVNLPLGSFVNTGAAMPLDFVSAADESPDFFGTFAIQWDDGGGGEGDPDTQFITSTLLVPPDYVSGGSVAVRIAKDFNTAAVEEVLRCQVNGGLVASVSIPTNSPTTYVLTPVTGQLAPGRRVLIGCGVGSGVMIDDNTMINAMEWRYTATQ